MGNKPVADEVEPNYKKMSKAQFARYAKKSPEEAAEVKDLPSDRNVAFELLKKKSLK